MELGNGGLRGYRPIPLVRVVANTGVLFVARIFADGSVGMEQIIGGALVEENEVLVSHSVVVVGGETLLVV
jgi:hypothetical protein